MKYPACTLASILNPGNYCVVTTDKEHVAEVRALEENMKKEMLSDDTSECSLNSQMFVAVEDFTGQLRRGIIEEKLNHDLYQVLLIDYGRIVQVKKSHMRVITNKDFIDVEPLAFVVRLYGLIPTKNVYMEEIKKPRASKEWVQESHKFVKDLFKDNQKVIVKDCLIHKRTVYGDLYIKEKPHFKFVSLRKLLCRNEFCIFSESNFLRMEGLNPPNQSSDFKTKMERVEKWQRENFGEIESNSYTFPSRNSSPCTIDKFCDSSHQNSQTSNAENTESSVDKTKRLGSGRGKLKQLIAEMKNKEKLSIGGLQMNSTRETEVEEEHKDTLEDYQESPPEVENVDAKPEESLPELENVDAKPEEILLEVESVDAKPEEILLEVENVDAKPEESLPEVESVDAKPEEILLEVENVDAKPEERLPEIKNGDARPEETTQLTKSMTESAEYCAPLISRTLGNEEEAKESFKVPTKPFRKKKIYGSSETITTQEGSFSEESFTLSKNTQVLKQPLNVLRSMSVSAPYVRFEDTIVEPVNSFKELPIQHSIIKNLEKGGNFCDLSQIQRWAIPAIRKQHNTVIIGSSKTGKTLSYVVPLMDYIQDTTYFEELPVGNGPPVVIVASSSRICESIYYMCHSLLGNHTKSRMKKSCVKIVLAHGNGCEKEVWVNLTNGCDILISTPHCLVRLLEYSILTNFERLTCLILNEIDIISQNPFRKNVRIILEKAKFATKDRHYQSILTGERWTPNVESLIKTYIKSYALIIGSSAEAVIYKKLKPNIHLVDRQHKPETLLSLLEDKIKKSKTLVVCEKDAEACRLNDFLTERGISSFVAHEKLTADRLRDIHASWKMSWDSVLVITDGILNEINVREVQTLVHFELPTKSKTNFYLRYATLEGFLLDSDNYLKTTTKDLNLQCIILVDDENHRQLPHIIDFVTRLGGKIPSKILGKCEEIRRVIETEKSDTPLCKNLLSFGRCRNSKDCPQRHALVKTKDSPKNLPTSGWVNFIILKAQDVSCFYAQLIEHVDLEGKSFKIEDRRSELHKKVAEFFKSEKNQRVVGVAKCGDVCGVKDVVEDKEVFYRAKVIEVLKVDKHGKALEVNVKLLDEGDVWNRKTTALFELPAELSSFPPTSTDIWVVGIQPMDFDVAWSGIANEFVSNIMTQKLQENQYWSGKIVLSLNNTLFLEPIKRKEFLPLLKTHVFDLVLQGELINKRIAVANNEHLPALLKLCSTGDIVVPKKEERVKEDLAVVQPQWAFFDSDFIRVAFLAAENTSTVFLQPKKFEKVLQELEIDCQKEAIESRKQKKKLGAITVGKFCLALFEDGKWNRGRIESENDTQFQIFFIDHGDFLFVSKSDVVPISQTLLLRLPCQAIECALVGINPKEESSLEVLQQIYSFSEDGKEDLYAYIIERNLEASVTNGRKYKINLLNKKGISLNKILVEKGMVKVEETEKKHLEDIEVVNSDDEGEEEEEIPPGGKESWESHFNNLTDDMFENEEALEFLKEFASKFLPISTPKAITPKEEITREVKEKKEVVKIIPEIQPEPQKNTDRTLKLKTRDKVLTPQVLWCQNQLEVQIKIIVGNVQDYNIECTMNNVSFRCYVKEKFYAVDLKLFGAINPQLTQVNVKAFHVVAILTKLASPLWPRLHADEGKHRWINLDVESLVDKEGDFYEKIQSVKQAIESGEIKMGIRSENIKACSDSEEEEIDLDDLEEDEDLD